MNTDPPVRQKIMIGEYAISERYDRKWFIAHKDGEARQTTAEALERILREFWVKEF
jgi:hypothetical protein